MPRLIIPSEPTSETFSVVTPEDTFALGFALFDPADLRVLVDDDLLDQSDFTFSGTLLTDGGYQGGVVVLDTPAPAASTVRIERAVEIARTTNLAPAASVTGADLDVGLNRATAQLQDLDRQKASANLANATIPMFPSPTSEEAFQPSAARYHRARLITPSDMPEWDPAPNAYNDAAVERAFAEAADQYASGEVAITYQTLCETSKTLPPNIRVQSLGNADISLVTNNPWGGRKGSLVFKDPGIGDNSEAPLRNGSQGLILSEGDTVVGINVLKDTVLGSPLNASDFKATLQTWAGDAITADSAPGVKIRDVTTCGWNNGVVIQGCERFALERYKGDNRSGIDIRNIFDCSWVDQVSLYPFYGQAWLRAHQNDPMWAALQIRPGIGVWLREFQAPRAADGVMISRILSIGYQQGVVFQNANACFLNTYWIDSLWGAVNQTNEVWSEYASTPFRPVGLTAVGDCQNSYASGGHVDSHWRNYELTTTDNTVGMMLNNARSGQAKEHQLVLGGSGSVDGFQYAGEVQVSPVLFKTGINDYSLDHVRGSGASGPSGVSIYKFDTPLDRRNIRVGEWVHNGQPVDTRPFASYLDVRPNINQTIPSGAYTKVQLATVAYDGLNEWDAINNRMVITKTGDYEIESVVSLTTPNVFGVTGSFLFFNGAPAGEPNLGTTPAGRASYPINQRVRLAAGDTIELHVYSDTGGTMTGGNSYLRVIRIPDRRF